ncbi:hypothetical protein P9112_007241 [Eukaryota sp. TZLM1-RC]
MDVFDDSVDSFSDDASLTPQTSFPFEPHSLSHQLYDLAFSPNTTPQDFATIYQLLCNEPTLSDLDVIYFQNHASLLLHSFHESPSLVLLSSVVGLCLPFLIRNNSKSTLFWSNFGLMAKTLNIEETSIYSVVIEFIRLFPSNSNGLIDLLSKISRTSLNNLDISFLENIFQIFVFLFFQIFPDIENAKLYEKLIHHKQSKFSNIALLEFKNYYINFAHELISGKVELNNISFSLFSVKISHLLFPKIQNLCCDSEFLSVCSLYLFWVSLLIDPEKRNIELRKPLKINDPILSKIKQSISQSFHFDRIFKMIWKQEFQLLDDLGSNSPNIEPLFHFCIWFLFSHIIGNKLQDLQSDFQNFLPSPFAELNLVIFNFISALFKTNPFSLVINSLFQTINRVKPDVKFKTIIIISIFKFISASQDAVNNFQMTSIDPDYLDLSDDPYYFAYHKQFLWNSPGFLVKILSFCRGIFLSLQSQSSGSQSEISRDFDRFIEVSHLTLLNLLTFDSTFRSFSLDLFCLILEVFGFIPSADFFLSFFIDNAFYLDYLSKFISNFINFSKRNIFRSSILKEKLQTIKLFKSNYNQESISQGYLTPSQEYQLAKTESSQEPSQSISRDDVAVFETPPKTGFKGPKTLHQQVSFISFELTQFDFFDLFPGLQNSIDFLCGAESEFPLPDSFSDIIHYKSIYRKFISNCLCNQIIELISRRGLFHGWFFNLESIQSINQPKSSLAKINFVKFPDNYDLCFDQTNPCSFLNPFDLVLFSEYENIRLFVNDLPCSNCSLGIVSVVSENLAEILVSSSLMKKSSTLFMVRLGSIYQYFVQMNNLRVLERNVFLSQIINPKKSLTIPNFEKISISSESALQRDQHHALDKILLLDGGFLLIDGVKNSGKTTTLIETVRTLVNYNKKVLICCQDSQFVFQFFSNFFIHPVCICEDYVPEESSMLANFYIVVSTLTMTSSDYFKPLSNHFDYILIDDCDCFDEVSVILPFKLAKPDGCVVLFGDSHLAKNGSIISRIGSNLKDSGRCVKLSGNFFNVSQLINLMKHVFYKHQPIPVLFQQPELKKVIISKFKPFMFFSVLSIGHKINKCFKNEQEACELVTVLNHFSFLLEQRMNESNIKEVFNISILSPFQSQLDLIMSKLAKYSFESISLEPLLFSDIREQKFHFAFVSLAKGDIYINSCEFIKILGIAKLNLFIFGNTSQVEMIPDTFLHVIKTYASDNSVCLPTTKYV